MRTVVFGEVLWDIFGKEAHIGGAPLNFAAHTAKLGGDVSLISAVGRDELGDRALEIINDFGIDASHVSRVDLPTGVCNVTLSDGTPNYELVTDVAYDAIPLPKREALGDALYFGTLAARDLRSRTTLQKLLQNPWREVFFDINIRQNFYTREWIDTALSHATILKISREEIGVLNLPGSCEEIAQAVLNKYSNLQVVIVTLDKDGAFAMKRGGTLLYAPKPQSAVVSTVGAGDSFSACFLHHHLLGTPLQKTLECACTLSDFVVTRTEAIPEYPTVLKEKIC